jgi:hypothetical protein
MSRNTFSNAIRSFSTGRALTLASHMLISALVLAPMTYADCLPPVPDGWTLPFSMSTHDVVTNVVGYSKGTLVETSSTLPYLSSLSSNFPQLFSDRLAAPCSPDGPPCTPQPFAANQPDYIQVIIARTAARVGYPAGINVSLILNSWGNAKYTFPAVCDPTTNLLYGSFNNNTMAVFSFGQPYNDPPTQ